MHCAPNIVRVNNSTIIRWVEHVARMGKKRNACVVVVRKGEEKKDLGLDGRIILKVGSEE